VERETDVARKPVQDAETAIMQVMTTAETGGVTTGNPETTFEEMLNGIRDSLSNLASPDDEQDGEDEEDDEYDRKLGMLSDDDEPGWVMGSLRQKQIRHNKLTQPGCGDADNYFCERHMKYGTVELKVLAVFKPQIDTTAATPSLITVAEHTQIPEII
jgi:hypothetical protein